MSAAAPSTLLAALVAACALGAAAVAALGLDRPLFLALNEAAAHLPADLPSCLTILGHGLVAVMLLSPALLAAPRAVAAGLLAVPLATLCTRVPKWFFAEPRPAAVLDPRTFHVHGQLLASHNSFPSGHAITAFVLVVVLAGGIEELRRRPLPMLALAAAGALVAASRVMVGAHWPLDVLAGAALGALCGAAGLRLAARWTFWQRPAGVRAMAIVVAACALVLARADLGYPLARPLQYALAAAGLGCALAALWRRAPPAAA